MKELYSPNSVALVMLKQTGKLQTHEVHPLRAYKCHGKRQSDTDCEDN